MKPILKIVSSLVIALLAVPPCIADDFCALAQNGRYASMSCCNGYGFSPTFASASDLAAQDCSQGCCSVAPAQTPLSATPEKLKTGAPKLDAPQHIMNLAIQTPGEFDPPAARDLASTSDPQALLRSSRI